MAQNNLDAAVFTVKLNPSKGTRAAPELELGIINWDKGTGPFTKAAIDNSGARWQVNDVSFTVGDLAAPGNGPVTITPAKKTCYQSMKFGRRCPLSLTI